MFFKLLFTFLCVAVASGTGEYMFCTSQEEGTGFIRGPKGETGRPGFPGLTGLSGRDAVVDYQRIYRKIDEKINTAMENIWTRVNERLNNLDDSLQRLQQRVITSSQVATAEPPTTGTTLSPEEEKAARLKAKGLCTVQHENICFWAEVHIRQDVYESTATNICQKDGGEVGNIYSRQHYEDVMALIRSVIPEGASTFDPPRVWTAMKVKPNGDATLSDDSPAPYVTWLASWYPSQGQTGIMLSVPIDPKAYYQGMTDIVPTRNAYGVLCQL